MQQLHFARCPADVGLKLWIREDAALLPQPWTTARSVDDVEAVVPAPAALCQQCTVWAHRVQWLDAARCVLLLFKQMRVIDDQLFSRSDVQRRRLCFAHQIAGQNIADR